MKKADNGQHLSPLASGWDGLPLLSGGEFSGGGILLLRAAYLLCAALPLILSLLKAVAGETASFLYFFGIALLAFPFVLDVLRRFLRFRPFCDSLALLAACALLIAYSFRSEAAVLLYFYHLCDALLCALLRFTRRRMSDHLNPNRFSTGLRYLDDAHTKIRVEELEALQVDCRILSGSAVCSLCLLDSCAGEFEAGVGDVLFAGTKVLSGEFTAEILSTRRSRTPERILRKTDAFLCDTPPLARSLQRFVPLVQCVYYVALLVFLSFPAGREDALLLSLGGLFCCTGLFCRLSLSRAFFVYDTMTRKGIYPATMRVLDRFWRVSESIRYLSSSLCARLGVKNRPSHVFRIKGAFPHKEIRVLEHASEQSEKIPASDLVLLYRDRTALEPFIKSAAKNTLLFQLLLLLALTLLAVAYLLLSLSANLYLALGVVLFVFLFSLAVTLRTYVFADFSFSKMRRK